MNVQYMWSLCHVFFKTWVSLRENVLLLTDVLTHPCAQWSQYLVFDILIRYFAHTVTLRVHFEYFPLALYTTLLCWKRMGDKLALSGDPTLLINTVHWQWAPVRSKIKYIWKEETESERMGWTKKKSSIHAGGINLQRSNVISHCECCILIITFYRWQTI